MSRRDDVMRSFNLHRDETDARVAAGIEQNRKGDFTVTVKDAAGRPVPGAKVQIKQKTHAFLHGANIFMLDELETAEKNRQYRDAFHRVCNQATLPFYWRDLEPEQGKPRFAKDSPRIYRRPAPDLCLEYCDEWGVTPKAHCLTYFNFTPDWVNIGDVADQKKKLEERYRTCAERYADRIHGWEVINELLGVPRYMEANAFYADDEVLEWNFRLAEKYFPHNELIVNEATHVWGWAGDAQGGTFSYNRSPYYNMIERGLKNGARIDTVGMQFHVFKKPEDERACHQSLYDPRMLFMVMDRYAKLGKPLQITEITIPAYTDDKEDEAIQADLLEQLYSIWFSHGAVETITYWNLVDGYAAFAPQGDMTHGENVFRAGLLRFDMSPKPAYERLYSLFEERWHTETQATTDANGCLTFRGFFGGYDLQVEGKTYRIETAAGKDNESEIVLM